jgi:hypothetical protein
MGSFKLLDWYWQLKAGFADLNHGGGHDLQ